MRAASAAAAAAAAAPGAAAVPLKKATGLGLEKEVKRHTGVLKRQGVSVLKAWQKNERCRQKENAM